MMNSTMNRFSSLETDRQKLTQRMFASSGANMTLLTPKQNLMNTRQGGSSFITPGMEGRRRTNHDFTRI